MGSVHRWREPLALRMAVVGEREQGQPSQVVIGVNFGSQAQWVRNVLTAGDCRMTMRGTLLHLVEPRLVPFDDAQRLFPRWFAWEMRRLARIEQCLGSLSPTRPLLTLAPSARPDLGHLTNLSAGVGR